MTGRNRRADQSHDRSGRSLPRRQRQEPAGNSALRGSRVHPTGAQFLGRCPGSRQRPVSSRRHSDCTASATGAHRGSGRSCAATPRTRSCRSASSSAGASRSRVAGPGIRARSLLLPSSVAVAPQPVSNPALVERVPQPPPLPAPPSESPIFAAAEMLQAAPSGRTDRSFAEGFRTESGHTHCD